MKLKRVMAFAAFMLAAIGTAPAATVVFSDNFDDGNVADWGVVTSYAGTHSVTVRSDSVVSAPFALFTFLNAPPGGSDLFVRATHSFNVPVAALYDLTLSARSSPCSGCTISFDVGVDNPTLSPLLRVSAPNAYQPVNLPVLLTAGVHTLWLGIHTTNASSGQFSASFDDVVISTAAAIPEPSTYALMLLGLGVLGLATRRKRTAQSAA